MEKNGKDGRTAHHRPAYATPRAHRVYLGLGTNLGDRWANMVRAINGLRAFLDVDGVSPVYETEPWGYAHQPPFLNMVVTGRTPLRPHKLLAALKQLERDLGRRPTFRYGPRVIDVDILFYEQECLETPDLVIPHPALHERAFVLVPLADLAPDLIHPRLKEPIRALLEKVDRSTVLPAI